MSPPPTSPWPAFTVCAWRGELCQPREPGQPRALPPLPARALGFAGCRPGPASSSPGRPSAASSRAFSRDSRSAGEERPRAQRVAPPGLGVVGAALLPRPRAPLRGTQLASFLPLPSSPARSRATAAVSLHIVRSLLPLSSPPPRPAFGLGISSLFITYFDPASLCLRFLRKFYCPRSRVFD